MKVKNKKWTKEIIKPLMNMKNKSMNNLNPRSI